MEKGCDSTFFPQDQTEDGKIINKIEIDKKAEIIRMIGFGIVTNNVIKKKKTDRPQLYDITELQRDANRIYGYTAAQVLYERYKVLTCPRTDSRFITSDITPYLEQRVKNIGSIFVYQEIADSVLKNRLNTDKKMSMIRKLLIITPY